MAYEDYRVEDEDDNMTNNPSEPTKDPSEEDNNVTNNPSEPTEDPSEEGKEEVGNENA